MLDEVISVETALRDYGVVVSAKGVVDNAATENAALPHPIRRPQLRLRPSQG